MVQPLTQIMQFKSLRAAPPAPRPFSLALNFYRSALQESRNLGGRLIYSNDQRGIKMDVALRHATGRMARRPDRYSAISFRRFQCSTSPASARMDFQKDIAFSDPHAIIRPPKLNYT